MNILRIISTILLTTIMAVSCAAESDKQINSIGFAKMLENGTITLTLVARAKGITGDHFIIFRDSKTDDRVDSEEFASYLNEVYMIYQAVLLIDKTKRKILTEDFDESSKALVH